jgi:hypothetical protein
MADIDFYILVLVPSIILIGLLFLFILYGSYEKIPSPVFIYNIIEWIISTFTKLLSRVMEVFLKNVNEKIFSDNSKIDASHYQNRRVPMIFGLKPPKVKSRTHAIFIIIFLFIVPLVVIIVGFVVIPRGGNVSKELADQWAEDICFAIAFLFPFGLYKAYGAAVALIKNDYGSESDYAICMNCYELISIHTVKKMICPKCTGVLENLGGFYTRHPELADKIQKYVRKPERAERNSTQ